MRQISDVVGTKRVKVDGTNYAAAAGTSDLASEAVDTILHDTTRFILLLGAITAGAVTSFKIQQCDTEGGSYADLEGTDVAVADDDDNKIVIVEIFRPSKRYLKAVIDRGTANAVVDGLIVEQSSSRIVPASNSDATVCAVETHISPDEA